MNIQRLVLKRTNENFFELRTVEAWAKPIGCEVLCIGCMVLFCVLQRKG